MDTSIPSCDRCGHVGVELAGMHPSHHGLVRWTLYSCGHMRTEVVLETLPTDEGSDRAAERLER
jgi:hypothetical protein